MVSSSALNHTISWVKFDGTDGVKVNDVKVVKADIVCSNGVIHVIESHPPKLGTIIILSFL